MRILIVSDHVDFGGAAIACSRLADGLAVAGADVVRAFAYGNDRGGGQGLVQLRGRAGRPVWDRLRHRLSTEDSKRRLTSRWCADELGQIIGEVQPDVINVHNIHGARWRSDVVERCVRHAPVVWTLHDMWSFTGRCAYRMECERLYRGCDSACPTPDEYPSLPANRIEAEWKAKQRLLDESDRLVAICPSRWLADEARRGIWHRRRVEVIPYGLDLDAFRSVERDVARRTLGISVEGPVLLTGSFHVNDPRKGLEYLLAALGKGFGHEVTVLTMGHGDTSRSIPGCKWIGLGSLGSPRMLSIAYSAADVFVLPSLADNLPNVIIESFACGTPVLAFRVGGIPEMVIPAKTGWLVNETSANALWDGLSLALDESKVGNNYRKQCREYAERNYSLEHQAARYCKLFEELV